MQKNPYVELSVSSPNYAWIRLSGNVVFEHNMAITEDFMANPMIKGQYKTSDNPIFEVFYLDSAHATIADMSGNAPKEYDL